MNVDDVREAYRLIKALEPCPYCGFVKPDSDAPIVHLPNCELIPLLTKTEARDIQ
jgi:hypothetical protein